MSAYDPYSYNPMLRAYFVNSDFTNRKTLPNAEVIQAAEANPQAAAHIYSVWGFLDWMRASSPELYSAIVGAGLGDPVAVVARGKVSPDPSLKKSFGEQGRGTLRGMGEFENTPGVIDEGAGYPGGPTVDLVSEWGTRIADLAGKYLQYDTQKQILSVNLKRAEKGLPPIDPGTMAPAVNFGLTTDTRQLVMWAVGGLVVIGAIMALQK